MSFWSGTSYTRVFAILLAIVVLSLLGSLMAADRALDRAERNAVARDTRLAAALARRDLTLASMRLAGAFGPLLEPHAPGALALPMGFRALSIMDTAGRPIASVPMAATSDSLLSRLARSAPDTGFQLRALASAGDTLDGDLLLVAPLWHRGRRLGVAVGRIGGRDLLRGTAKPAGARQSAALRTHDATLASLSDGTQVPHLSYAVPLGLAGDTIALVLRHARERQAQRSALWAIGVVALIGLVAGLARERSQALRLTARTGELERLYQEVARSNRMKSEFLANISHELRTPLNAVVGFVEMLREGVYGELTPRQALPVDRIAASATHLRLLVDRLLDIAKIAAGRVDLHMEPLVLRPFVLNVASEMESLVAERGLSLTLGIPASTPRVRTDHTHLRQILINLIGNAVKYTSQGGIQIRSRMPATAPAPDELMDPTLTPPDPEGRWVALQVSDTGIGIPAADFERIFDEFEQVNPGPRTDSARRGTGLGLAISRRLARLLGGDITVTSVVGAGSTFTVWLPADGPDASTEATRVSAG